MPSHKILNIAPSNQQLQDSLRRELGISKIMAQLLINRGIKNAQDAGKFLDTKLSNLYQPSAFSSMPKALSRIHKAVRNREKVMLFGDYDVDGITSLALLKPVLARLGLDVIHSLPHRVKDGYGVNRAAVQEAKEKKVKLFITADCGTNNREAVRDLKMMNIDVIITDHHEPCDEEIAAADCIINPKLKESGYPFRDLAGVGVAYKFAQAITDKDLFEDLDLVCLGTIADVVPLTGENRIIVKEGLRRLCVTEKLGIRAIIESSRLRSKEMNAEFVSFILGPRINASGRIDSADISLDLLLSDNWQQAKDCSRIIEANNRKRQKIEAEILEEAQDLISREVNFKEHKIIVLAKEGWHRGVLGIVASKIADKFYRPTIIISLTDGMGRGSGRSIKNFHLFEALYECRGQLLTFGGHKHAVGLVINRDSIAAFRERINYLANERLALQDLLPSLEVDLCLNFPQLSDELARELEILEPFGECNPEPLFYTSGLKVKGEVSVLGRNTLKFWVTDGQATRQAIAFGMAHNLSGINDAESLDLVYTLRMDSWQGEEEIILEVKDILFKP